MISYEDFLAQVAERKRKCWVEILASEPPGRPAGRRPRDPLKETILTRFDHQRLDQLAAQGSPLATRPADSGAEETE